MAAQTENQKTSRPNNKPDRIEIEIEIETKTETETDTETKSERKSKSKFEIRNSKWNHIMTIAKRSDNAKCEIKFAFAARPLPLNISTSNDRNGAPQTRCSCNKILHTCSGNLPLINLCTYFVASRRGETGVQQGVYVLPGRAKPECSASF